MLTKSEYSTSTSSLSTVFSGSLQELNSKLRKSCLPEPSSRASHKSSFRNRLRDRINKNKSRIAELNQAIEVSNQDALQINQMKKMLLQNEVTPLMTFVDQVKNTTDDALLSMQRELADKEKDLGYVVYDRNVIWLDQKFSSEESSYLKHFQQANNLFKKNYVDKYNAKYEHEIKQSQRLLQEGESLLHTCKQQIEEMNKKMNELVNTIRQKEETLAGKMHEFNQLSQMITKDSQGSNTHMKSYILEAKLKKTKQDIRRLQNEKMELEASEIEYNKELDNLKITIARMNKRNEKEIKQVKEHEAKVGALSDLVSVDIEKRSIVESNEKQLATYLKKKKEIKEKLLSEVNSKKSTLGTRTHRQYTDTKTVRPVDWNHIDEETASYHTHRKEDQKVETTPTKKDEETKSRKPVDEDKAENLSLFSFDPDWETPQADSRLPNGLQLESSKFNKKGSKTPNSTNCKPFASSRANRSRYEAQQLETEPSESMFWSCNKILEEADEDSVANLTPRLDEECEKKANDLEDSQRSLYITRDSNCKRNQGIYASRATLETEESSECKFDNDSETSVYGKECENPLSLSMTSSADMSTIDEKFMSPTALPRTDKVPLLNLSKVKRAAGLNSLNSSTISTNYSSNNSTTKNNNKKRLSVSDAYSINAISKTLMQGKYSKPKHMKNNLSQGKPVTSKKLNKGLVHGNGAQYQTFVNQVKCTSPQNQPSWKASKLVHSNVGFEGNHWDFSKKRESLNQS